MNFRPFDIIVLFGAIQGFTLCLYLFPKRKVNLPAYWFFVLLVASISYFNLSYGLMMMEVNIHTNWPIPYKYFIGVGFYFFIKYHVRYQNLAYFKREYYLIIPAVLYGILRSYWFYLIVSGENTDITLDVYKTGFFTYNEFAYLIFDLVLSLFVIKFLHQEEMKLDTSKNNLRNWRWLKYFSYLFLLFTSLHILNLSIMVGFDATDNFMLYTIILIINSIFIYYTGFVGFSQASTLLKPLRHSSKNLSLETTLDIKLQRLMGEEEIFKNSKLKRADLANKLKVSSKELSDFIRERYQMSFSEYLNFHRVENVKKLLKSSEAEKYTLVHLAEQSGFSSKSSFNSIFKKMTGLTPRDYRNSK
ncbi:helix-turn-helix domain-containing protein [Xanthovirga aplysinae]|uniref:helix-turn-helix domain-containing protein n=1 Tax=Xanthovirga aplysinae TaxID=2529853 RepID=UPI0012BBF7BB|nr:helix-turn-helix domain-containing protein [Xanthovirga aplysinae]MTI33018.1 AraC family transcriptional regulator [Xanthovirga aplysinae]